MITQARMTRSLGMGFLGGLSSYSSVGRLKLTSLERSSLRSKS